jgi:hypothetical protein
VKKSEQEERVVEMDLLMWKPWHEAALKESLQVSLK